MRCVSSLFAEISPEIAVVRHMVRCFMEAEVPPMMDGYEECRVFPASCYGSTRLRSNP